MEKEGKGREEEGPPTSAVSQAAARTIVNKQYKAILRHIGNEGGAAEEQERGETFSRVIDRSSSVCLSQILQNEPQAQGRKRRRLEEYFWTKEDVNQKKVILLDKDVLWIGRSNELCDIVLKDTALFGKGSKKLLSRKHAMILNDRITNSWTIVDNGGVNGTFVNEIRIAPRQQVSLGHGDVIKFGPKLKAPQCNRLSFRFQRIEDSAQNVHEAAEDVILPFSFQESEQSSSMSLKINKQSRVKELLEKVFKDLEKKGLSIEDESDETLAKLAGECLLKDYYSKQKPEPKSTTNESISKVENELTCSVCCELLLYAHTLSCGHSFCKGCIDKWLQNHLSCPLCREVIEKLPIPSQSIDRAIQIVLQSSSDKSGAINIENPDSSKGLLSLSLNAGQTPNELEAKDKDSSKAKVSSIDLFKQRQREYDEEVEENKRRKNRLIELLQQAKTMGFSLVHVSKPWSDREQTRFLQGIRTYTGCARLAYCESVDFSRHFIGRATTSELITACENLRVTPIGGKFVVDKEEQVDYARWVGEETGNARDRLRMFVHYG